MKAKGHGIRFLIGLGSLAGFFGGWVLLAHAPKPVGATSTARAEIAAPIPDFLAPQGLQPFRSLQDSPTFRMPQLRTHAS